MRPNGYHCMYIVVLSTCKMPKYLLHFIQNVLTVSVVLAYQGNVQMTLQCQKQENFFNRHGSVKRTERIHADDSLVEVLC